MGPTMRVLNNVYRADKLLLHVLKDLPIGWFFDSRSIIGCTAFCLGLPAFEYRNTQCRHHPLIPSNALHGVLVMSYVGEAIFG